MGIIYATLNENTYKVNDEVLPAEWRSMGLEMWLPKNIKKEYENSLSDKNLQSVKLWCYEYGIEVPDTIILYLSKLESKKRV